MWYYREPIRQVIHRFKYEGITGIIEEVSDEIMSLWPELPLTTKQVVVTDVPSSHAHWQERGFNQSALLARSVSQKLQVPYESFLVRRANDQSQTKLSRRARFANVADQFQAMNPSLNLRGTTVVIIDDVITTGATLAHCARVLKQHDARAVWALTLAKD